MIDHLKSLIDRLILKPDTDDTRYGCEFSIESINEAPTPPLEEE